MSSIELYKGIAPGAIISHEIKKRGQTQKELAGKVRVQSQVISSIVTGNRSIPESLSYRLDEALGFEEGFFLVIQAYHKIKKHKNRNLTAKTEKPEIRPVVFWDIDFDKLDWSAHKSFIINRVNERGNQSEKELIKKYYDL